MMCQLFPGATGYRVGVEATRWLDPREARAWRALQLMNLRVDGELARRLAAETGLSYPDYVVLVALSESAEGRMRFFEMARLLGWEKSRLSHHVNRMTERGLVGKEQCASDRRGLYAVLTAEGRRAITAAAPGHVAAVRELFVDRLTSSQLDAVADAAETVLAALDRADAGADQEAGSPR